MLANRLIERGIVILWILDNFPFRVYARVDGIKLNPYRILRAFISKAHLKQRMFENCTSDGKFQVLRELGLKGWSYQALWIYVATCHNRTRKHPHTVQGRLISFTTKIRLILYILAVGYSQWSQSPNDPAFRGCFRPFGTPDWWHSEGKVLGESWYTCKPWCCY